MAIWTGSARLMNAKIVFNLTMFRKGWSGISKCQITRKGETFQISLEGGSLRGIEQLASQLPATRPWSVKPKY